MAFFKHLGFNTLLHLDEEEDEDEENEETSVLDGIFRYQKKLLQQGRQGIKKGLGTSRYILKDRKEGKEMLRVHNKIKNI